MVGAVVDLYRSRRSQVLYLMVGGWNTLFGYTAWAVLQFLLGGLVHYLVIVVISWPIAVLNAFLGYRYFVFQSRGPIVRELPRFSVVYAVTLLANLALLPIALRVLPFNIYVIQALFAAAVIATSYVAHKYYSFGGTHRRDALDAAVYDPKAAPRD
jgi:putative flippase GtrA